MSTVLVGIYDDPETATELKSRVAREQLESDRLVELNTRSLEGDGRVGDTPIRSPSDIKQWLLDGGFDEQIAEFYAESVRHGHNVIVFEAERDDEHVGRVEREMKARESHEMAARLERWKQGEREVFEEPERTEMQSDASDEPSAADGGSAEQRIPIVEERPTIGKAETTRGGATVHTHVESEPIEEQVSLREESIDVERRPADRPAEGDEAAFEESSVEFSERAEEPIVGKEARVVEEVVVTKDTTERTATIRDVLRKTAVDVDTYGDVDDAQLRAEFEAQGGGDFAEYQRAARFGHAYGGHEQLRDVDYEEAEPSLRERYESQHGEGTFDRMRDSIRTWWNRARGD